LYLTENLLQVSHRRMVNAPQLGHSNFTLSSCGEIDLWQEVHLIALIDDK